MAGMRNPGRGFPGPGQRVLHYSSAAARTMAM